MLRYVVQESSKARGFREVFARLSLPKYFRERFRRAENKINQFLRAAGAPAAPRAPPNRGPRGTQKLVRTKTAKNDGQKFKKKNVFVWYLVCGTLLFRVTQVAICSVVSG